MDETLTSEERMRYARQLCLPEIGLRGQQQIRASSVLIVGIGGLGCPVAMYLAAAGVGRIGMVENDVVEESNLQRQVLFDVSDVGSLKVDVAAKKIKGLNPQLRVDQFPVRLSISNAASIFTSFDIIVDATDNFSTKYLINDVCVAMRKLLIYASISQFEGQIGVFDHRFGADSLNYRDIFPSPPPSHLAPNCMEAGVVGSLPGLFGCLEANEVIKAICGIPSGLAGGLFCMDTISMEAKTIRFDKCNDNPLRVPGFSLASIAELGVICGVSNDSNVIDHYTLFDWIRSAKLFQFVDVRTVEERSHISFGGLCLPLQLLETNSCSLNKDMPIVFYCKSGIRSKQAKVIMQSIHPAGHFYSLKGGADELSLSDIQPESLAANFASNGVLLSNT